MLRDSSVKDTPQKGGLLGTSSCPEISFVAEQSLGTDGAAVYTIGVKTEAKALLTLNWLTYCMLIPKAYESCIPI